MWLVHGSESTLQQFQLVVLSGDGDGSADAQEIGAAAVVPKVEEPVKEERVIISDTRPHNRVSSECPSVVCVYDCCRICVDESGDMCDISPAAETRLAGMAQCSLSAS